MARSGFFSPSKPLSLKDRKKAEAAKKEERRRAAALKVKAASSAAAAAAAATRRKADKMSEMAETQLVVSSTVAERAVKNENVEQGGEADEMTKSADAIVVGEKVDCEGECVLAEGGSKQAEDPTDPIKREAARIVAEAKTLDFDITSLMSDTNNSPTPLQKTTTRFGTLRNSTQDDTFESAALLLITTTPPTNKRTRRASTSSCPPRYFASSHSPPSTSTTATNDPTPQTQATLSHLFSAAAKTPGGIISLPGRNTGPAMFALGNGALLPDSSSGSSSSSSSKETSPQHSRASSGEVAGGTRKSSASSTAVVAEEGAGGEEKQPSEVAVKIFRALGLPDKAEGFVRRCGGGNGGDAQYSLPPRPPPTAAAHTRPGWASDACMAYMRRRPRQQQQHRGFPPMSGSQYGVMGPGFSALPPAYGAPQFWGPPLLARATTMGQQRSTRRRFDPEAVEFVPRGV